MGVQDKKYWRVVCDHCFSHTDDYDWVENAENDALGSGWVKIHGCWLCWECKPKEPVEPINKTNRDNMNVQPIIDLFANSYGIMLTTGEATEMLEMAFSASY